MNAGIAPQVLLAQVQNTAAWALAEPTDARWQLRLRTASDLESRWRSPDARNDYLGLLLAAHFATVGTFVPTDVDTRIRHHVWEALRSPSALAEALTVVDETDAWDPHTVSARVVDVPGVGVLSGHDGEWLAVRAGALGRALALGAADIAEALSARIDAEVDREVRAFERVKDAPGREVDALRICTVLAHNAGDLSRVVEAWPSHGARTTEFRDRYARLGHEPNARFGGLMALAGRINKAVTATENHRFLVLRKARPLRSARELLLPIGPFFDAWGERIAKRLDPDERSAVLDALLEGHESDPTQAGYLRAMAGLHRAAPGGIDAMARGVSARLRKLVAGGAVRDAVRVEQERFEQRMANRYRAALRAAE